jgi:hypothetical protein
MYVTGKTVMTKKCELPVDELKLTNIRKSNRIPRNRCTFQLGA